MGQSQICKIGHSRNSKHPYLTVIQIIQKCGNKSGSRSKRLECIFSCLQFIDPSLSLRWYDWKLNKKQVHCTKCKDVYLWWMNANVDSCTIDLLTLNTFNVNDVFFAINLNNFARLRSLEMSSHNLDHNHIKLTIFRLPQSNEIPPNEISCKSVTWLHLVTVPKSANISHVEVGSTWLISAMRTQLDLLNYCTISIQVDN